MRITQLRSDPFGTFIHNQHQNGMMSSEECAAVFGRLIVNAAMDDQLSESWALRWGTHAGHYGRLALAEQEQEHFDVGLGVIRDAFPAMAGAR